jgi:hypothetical protein
MYGYHFADRIIYDAREGSKKRSKIRKIEKKKAEEELELL